MFLSAATQIPSLDARCDTLRWSPCSHLYLYLSSVPSALLPVTDSADTDLRQDNGSILRVHANDVSDWSERGKPLHTQAHVVSVRGVLTKPIWMTEYMGRGKARAQARRTQHAATGA